MLNMKRLKITGGKIIGGKIDISKSFSDEK